MTLSKENVQAAWAKAEAALQGGGGGFMKLTKDANNVRILPALDGSPIPFTKSVRYVVNIGTQAHYVADLDAVYSDPELLEAALAARKLTEEDVKLIEKYGMPMGRLRKAMFAASVKYKDMPRGVKNDTRLLFNVIDVDNEPDITKARPKVLETPQSIFNGLKSLITGDYPELFSAEEGRAVNIQGNGKDGRDRRYTNVTPAKDAVPIPDEVMARRNDLQKDALRNVVPFMEVMAIFDQAFGGDLEKYGTKLSDFGPVPAQGSSSAPPEDTKVPSDAVDVADGFKGLS